MTGRTAISKKTLYQYTPLRARTNFRIVRIAPGKYGSPIQCSLVEGNPGDATVYYALSYVWGTAKSVWRIDLDSDFLPVTTSLYRALQHFRLQDQPLNMWIDQVCINQRDFDERDQQVMLMRDIYAKSRKVYIWLGENAEDHAAAFNFMRKSLNAAGCPQDHFDVELIDPRYALSKAEHMPEPGDAVLDSLEDLYENVWFRRSWTFQETVCATHAAIFVGNLSIDFAILWNFTWLFMAQHLGGNVLLLSSMAALAIEQILVMGRSRFDGRMNSMLELAKRTRERSATDPRDKLYSLLGVASPIDPLSFAPNHRSETAKVYRDFAAHNIRETNSLEILQHVTCVESDIQGTGYLRPSWVPEWRIEKGCAAIDNTATPFNAAKLDHIIGEILESELAVYGIDVDRIALTTTHLRNGRQNCPDDWLKMTAMQQPILKEIYTLVTTFNASSSAQVQSQTWPEALVGGRLLEQYRRADPTYLQLVQTYVDLLLTTRAESGPDTTLGDGDKQTYMKIATRINGIATNREFCITSSGRLGWVSRFSREGDVVSVLYGSRVPILLRKTDGRKYTVIEQCYIQGIMEGEVIEEAMRVNGMTDDEIKDEAAWARYVPRVRFDLV